MQSVVNLARGSVRVEVQGIYPERFINMCAENEIAFWDLERVDEVTIRVTMNIGGYKKMRPLLDNVMCTAKTVNKRGAPFFLWRLRKRYALIIGFIGVMVVTWVMSLYIWDISVEGNDKVLASDILEVLDEYGVSVGTYGPSIDAERLRNEVLLELEDLSWITVRVNGSKATIVVRERIEIPEMLGDDTPAAIVAEKSGIIEEMIVFDGSALRAVGDTVAEGDDIVSGVMDSISSGSRLVTARAEIYARTWYEYSAQMPLETWKKDYNGDIHKKISIIFGGNRINLYLNSGISYAEYDKIVKEDFLRLPGGIVLPVKVSTSTYVEYNRERYELDADEAAEILKDQLMTKLEGSIEEDGKVTDVSYNMSVDNGIITVTLSAECLEQISKSRDLTAQELAIPDNTEENAGENELDD